ncbi:MAG: hypothetical protein ACR2LC_12850 [Pyrinomonadaceae bacterium]
MSETIYHGDRSGGHEDERRTPDTGHIQNPDVQHEMSDVDVGAILKFIVVLAIGIALIFGIAAGAIKAFNYVADEVDPDIPSPMALKEEDRMPPEPRLQLAKGWNFEGHNLELQEPQAERRMLLEKWNKQMEQSGTDPQTGAVHTPVKEAMRMVVEQNMPARQMTAKQLNSGKVTNEGIPVPDAQSSGQQTDSRDK